MGKSKIDFEINLLPVISLLAVCISFLLLTAVWVQIGSTGISQAVGSTSSQTQDSPSFWVEFSEQGHLLMTLKNVRKAPKSIRKFKLRSFTKGKINWKKFLQHTEKVKLNVPNIKTAMILPKKSTSYDNIIQVIDNLKKINITDIGVAPL